MESLVRITFVGSGGSLVGLALQKQQSFTATPRPVVLANSNYKHLPMTWALSCMLFALVMETSRIVSPTSSLLTHWSSSSSKEESFYYGKYQTMAATAIGDCTVGGMVAGLAGVLGMHRQQRNRGGGGPILIAWGLGVGALLGGLLGTIQAGIDVGNVYLLEQQNLQQEEGHEKNDSEQDVTQDSR